MTTVIDEALQSPLLAAQGVLVQDLLTPAELSELRVEASQCRRHAVEARDGGALDAWDRGNPGRWLEQAAGGPALDRFLGTNRLLDVLRGVTNTDWQPLGSRGSFSYYDRPGHYLGMHRDIVSCDLTCIICVDVQKSDPDASGGVLRLHPWAVRTPLDEVHDHPDRAIEVELVPGQVAILLGGIIPHELTAVRGSLQRTVAPLCFSPLR